MVEVNALSVKWPFFSVGDEVVLELGSDLLQNSAFC